MAYFNDPAEEVSTTWCGDFDLAGYQWVNDCGTSLTFDVYIRASFDGYEDSNGAAQSDFSILISEASVLLTVDSGISAQRRGEEATSWDMTVVFDAKGLRRLWPLLDPHYKDPEEFILERLGEVEFLSGLPRGSASWCPTKGVREEYPCMDFTFSGIFGEPE